MYTSSYINSELYMFSDHSIARSYQGIDNKRARKMKLRSRSSTLADKMLPGRHSGLSMTQKSALGG